MPINDRPASTGGGAGRRRYLIGSFDTTLLARVVEDLKADPAIVVDRVLQTSTGAGGIVVEATEEQAAHLRARYPGLVVEPDQPLSQFSADHASTGDTPTESDMAQRDGDTEHKETKSAAPKSKAKATKAAPSSRPTP